MKKPDITPGPWVALEGEPKTLRDICRLPICDTIIKAAGDKPTLAEQESRNKHNAQAIAAVPDLLAELENTLNHSVT